MRFERGQFDLARLGRSIEQARAQRGLTWAELSREVGVATSTIRRFATATDAEADGVLALIGWLGVAPEDFVVDSEVAGVPLPTAGAGFVRVDMRLLADAPGGPRRAPAGSRTTIQQLVMAGRAAGAPLASLTRRSAV